MPLNREYTVAEYLTAVTDSKLRNALTMYRLSEHAIERGRRASQEKTGYVHTAHEMKWKLSCTS